MSLKVVAILQARLNSSRLPRKMLLPLAGAPLVQRVIERVCRATKLDDIVLAVPYQDRGTFAPFCNGRCWLHWDYQVDEADLVGRYLSAAKAYAADIIIRVPCDNPLVEPAYIDAAVSEYLDNLHVYYSNTTAAVIVHEGTAVSSYYVDGIGAEVFSYSRLQWLDHKVGSHTYLREHQHAYFNPQLHPADVRLDINTEQDYLFVKDLYDALYPTNPQFTVQDVLAYLDRKKVTV